MRKLNYLLAFLMFATLGFISCSSDDDEPKAPPTITITQEGTNTAFPNFTITYKCVIDAPEELSNFLVKPIVNGNTGTEVYMKDGENIEKDIYIESTTGKLKETSTKSTIYFDYVVPTDISVTSVEIVFTAIDKKGQTKIEPKILTIGEPKKPTISVSTYGNPTYQAGTTVNFVCVLEAEAKITHFLANSQLQGLGTQAYEHGSSESIYAEGSTFNAVGELKEIKTNREIYFDYVVPANTNETTIEIKFTVKDKAEQTTTYTEVITIASGTLFGTERTGSISHAWGAGAGAYDLVNDKVMMEADADTDKDMKNISSASDITFIAGWKAGTGNTSTFAKVSGLDYATATVEEAKEKFDAVTPSAEIASVVEGDVVVAKLRNDKYAIIKITKIDPEDATKAGKGKMTFTYKKGSINLAK